MLSVLQVVVPLLLCCCYIGVHMLLLHCQYALVKQENTALFWLLQRPKVKSEACQHECYMSVTQI